MFPPASQIDFKFFSILNNDIQYSGNDAEELMVLSLQQHQSLQLSTF
jgi:hypothetical protein